VIACPAGGQITIRNDGNTLYYDDVSTVTSSSNDGSIATGASATFTKTQYVICAQGASTSVFVYTPDYVTGELQSTNFLSGTGGPASGPSSVSGTGANRVGVGAVYVNETNGVSYVNEGTTASPYWTPVSFTQPGILGIYEDFRGMPADLATGGMLAITDTGTVNSLNSGVRVGGLGLAETDSGIAPATNVEGSHVARITATNEDAKGIFLSSPSTVAMYQPDTHSPLAVDVEFTAVTAITVRTLFVGFIGVLADNAAPPITGATTTATFSPDDIAGIFQSTNFTDGDGLMLVSEKSNLAGTQVGLAAAADLDAAATYQRLRVEVQADGTTTAFKNKAYIGKCLGAVSAGVHGSGVALDADEELIPCVFFGSQDANTKSWDVKRFAYWGTRS
jgi:hypothetical protein